jgi:uncharacterized protein with HEPN domain
MRNDRERLLDIKEAIENIKKYASHGKDAFINEELVQVWILHHIQILGEAAARLSDEFQECHHDIPWYKIIGMRNILVHDYFGIDIEAVWSVVNNDLPVLYNQVKTLLNE